MIGANDFGYAKVLERCIINWFFSPDWWRNYCSHDADIANRVTPSLLAQLSTARLAQRQPPGAPAPGRGPRQLLGSAGHARLPPPGVRRWLTPQPELRPGLGGGRNTYGEPDLVAIPI